LLVGGDAKNMIETSESLMMILFVAEPSKKKKARLTNFLVRMTQEPECVWGACDEKLIDSDRFDDSNQIITLTSEARNPQEKKRKKKVGPNQCGRVDEEFTRLIILMIQLTIYTYKLRHLALKSLFG
jgi:hypothetical protein